MSVKSARKALSPEEIIRERRQDVDTLKQQCYAVERMIGLLTDQQIRTDEEVNDARRQTALVEQKMIEADRLLDEQVNYMQKFSKISEEQLRQRSESLRRSCVESQKEMEALRTQLTDMEASKHATIQQLESEISEQQRRIDEKALLFGMRLKEMLNRIHPKEKKNPIRKKMKGFSTATLAENNGRNGSPIYISIKNVVYDCSSAAEFYGEGQPYEVFAGKDVTRCLAMLSLHDGDANKDWTDLSAEELETLDEWVAKFQSKYPVVGSCHFLSDGGLEQPKAAS